MGRTLTSSTELVIPDKKRLSCLIRHLIGAIPPRKRVPSDAEYGGQIFPDTVLKALTHLVVLFEVVALLLAAVSPNWRHVDHASAEFDESTPAAKDEKHIVALLLYERHYTGGVPSTS
jgi:hypothetical protein